MLGTYEELMRDFEDGFESDRGIRVSGVEAEVEAETQDGRSDDWSADRGGKEDAAEFSSLVKDVIGPLELEADAISGIERFADSESGGDRERLELFGRELGAEQDRAIETGTGG
jgi:hypothetical protein